MDITTQAVAETAAIHIKGADGEYLYDESKNPCRIVIYSPGSKEFAAIEARQSNRAIKRLNDNDGKVQLPSPDQREAEQAEDLADITVAFENFTYPPAGKVQGKELFKAFYADRSLGFIKQQILKAVNDWGNFKSG